MVELESNIRLSVGKVEQLVDTFSGEFIHPLISNPNIKPYIEKMAEKAWFILGNIQDNVIGFVAFYKNMDKQQLYITLIVVDSNVQGKGVGHLFIEDLEKLAKVDGFKSIALEVRKTNTKAYRFYLKEGFDICADRDDKWLMRKNL